MQTINLNTRKYELISQVMQIEKEKNIRIIEDFFAQLFYKPVLQKEYDAEIFKPIRKNISIEEMKKEQNFTGFDRYEFDKLIKEINIQEPLSELLNMI